MPDDIVPHVDLAAYVLGRLEPQEREGFEAHLADCSSCQAELAELSSVARLLPRAAIAYDVPAGLEARVLGAVERAAAAERTPTEPRRGRWAWNRRPTLALAALAAVLTLVLAATQIDRFGGPTPELQAVLAPPGGGEGEANVTVVETGIGREIAFRTDDLPILPKTEYYELWFVAPGDTLERPRRISAGTFHPDERGRSHADFTAAVDPKRYPVVSVTAEPGDGNPARTGPEVLRSG